MSKCKYENTFCLEAAEIDNFSLAIEMTLEEMGIEHQNILRIRLSLEESLLRFRDRFGEEAVVQTVIASRFGKSFIQIELEGDAYNPLSKTESELDDWNGPLLTAVGLSPQYNYYGSRNVLRLNLPSGGVNPIIKTFVSVVGGILIGVLGNIILSDSVQFAVTDNIFVPVYDLWYRMLNLISGPVIFFMVITAVLNSEKITEQGGESSRVIIRYFVLSTVYAAVSAILGILIFHLPIYEERVTTHMTAGGFFDGILKLIPEEIFSPLMAVNTPQILVMAIVIGSAMNVIGAQARALSRVIKQINMVGLLMAEWIGKLAPYFIVLLLGFEIWEKRTALLTVGWKAMLISLILSFLAMASMILYICRSKKVPLRLFLKKLWKPFRATVSSGSIDAAFGLTEKSCVHDLGMEKGFISFALPHGIILFMPVSAIGCVVFTIFAASVYGVKTSFLWHAMLIVMAVTLSAAAPPVAGASLLTYMAIFAQLKIPSGALIDAMVFDLIFGFFASAANQAMLQAELIRQADRIGMLNLKKLRKAGRQDKR